MWLKWAIYLHFQTFGFSWQVKLGYFAQRVWIHRLYLSRQRWICAWVAHAHTPPLHNRHTTYSIIMSLLCYCVLNHIKIAHNLYFLNICDKYYYLWKITKVPGNAIALNFWRIWSSRLPIICHSLCLLNASFLMSPRPPSSVIITCHVPCPSNKPVSC